VSSLDYLFLEIIEVGRGDHGLGTLEEVLGQVVTTALVELAHHVVEEEYGILPRLPPRVVPRRELERERRQPLLPLGTVGRQVYPIEQNLEVVPVRPDGGRAAFDVGAVRLSERLGVPV
jgi:hypothetical protein